MASTGMVLGFNLSAQTLSDPQLWSFVDRLIDETGAPPEKIVFEITETAAVTNFDAAERFVRSARERQCRIALDDFGSGLSSFEYLRRFPIDTIKINGSFVQHMAESKFDREIVASINGIAKSLGYMVVAERIENQRTFDMLVEMGVEFGQGYFLHRPEPLENIVAEHAKLAAERRARRLQAG
jgi:EAL domain-containing protein (putative c-di-GMP-specific phosphodiesterase class I)